MMMWWPYGTGMGWWMILWMVVFWGGLIVLIVWGARKLTGCCSTQKQNNPLDIAKERYAKGEISKEQFDQLKKDLF